MTNNRGNNLKSRGLNQQLNKGLSGTSEPPEDRANDFQHVDDSFSNMDHGMSVLEDYPIKDIN